MSPIISRSNMMLILAAALMALLAACSSQNSQALFDPKTGKHPADWVQMHPTNFLNKPSQCTECHGADLHGGISNVSCFSASFNGIGCHLNGPSGHPAGWASPAQHGAAAKAAPNSTAMQGFSTCQLCHANDFTGGFSQTSCMNTAGCHGVGVMSPHPVSWSSGTASTYHHNTTDPGNAPVCALCHTAGANSPIAPPSPPAPAGTAPGCFNSTLCHGPIGHPAGWAVPAQHGVAAKTAPNAQNGTGFSICQTCHGNDFTGDISTQTCLNTAGCHGVGVNAPHAFPWKSTSTLKHSTTDPANGPVCGLCHLGNPATPVYAPLPPGATPGCFNNTLCHANVGTCTTCHATPQNGRRIVTGPSGDFVKADHHVTNGTTTEIVNDAACAICHGDIVTNLGHPTGAPASPTVQLMDPDTGAVVTATTGAGVEQVCAGCHDGNGASRLGASALTPFSVATTPDTTPPPNIGWTVGQQAHSFNAGNGAGGCLACHGDAGSGNAHGSSQPKMMKYTFTSTDTVKATTNVCYNCHGQTATNGTTNNVGADFLPATQVNGHATVTCFDCHDQHTAKTGTHVNATTLAGVLNGATGKGVTTWNPGTWTGVATYAATAAATAEWQVCFKCHAGPSLPTGTGGGTFTDLGLEFSPNNESGHPIVAGLNNYPNSLAPKAVNAAYMVAPWTNVGAQTMTCTDCHATDTVGHKGPHGSAIKWMLTGTNRAWPYTSAASNGAQTGTLFRMATYNTNNGTINGLFCLNCHVVAGTNNWHSNSDVTGGEHGGNSTLMACANCHIRIPHGGKISRLLQTTNAPARYKANAGGSATAGTLDAWGGSGGIKGSSVSNANFNSSCGQHNSGTGEAW